MNGWFIAGISFIVLGALFNLYGQIERSRPEPQLTVSCTDGKTYRNVDIMMFMEGKTILFTERGQTVIPGSITCNGRAER